MVDCNYTFRYCCNFQVSYGCPCSHEFTVMVKLDTYQYYKRWLCKQKFEELYPELCPSLHVKSNNEYSVSQDSIDEDIVNKLPSDYVICATTKSNLHDVELP